MVLLSTLQYSTVQLIVTIFGAINLKPVNAMLRCDLQQE